MDDALDTYYVACSSAGARRKMQTIRHNIEEFKCVASECHHDHDRQEWAPQEVQKTNGGTFWWYPSEDEAEYTAVLVFQLAVAASSIIVGCEDGQSETQDLQDAAGKCERR